jgi:hypothetical protein
MSRRADTAGCRLSPCAVPKPARTSLSWHFSTKDMFGPMAARRQYLTLDVASPAKIRTYRRFMIRTGQVSGITQRGDRRTASESPRHDRAQLRQRPAHAPRDGLWHGTGCPQ